MSSPSSLGESSAAADGPSVSVIIPAFTEDRWDQLCLAVHGCLSQSQPPLEVIIAIDRNDSLLSRATAQWSAYPPSPKILVIDGSGTDFDDDERALHAAVHGSRRRFGAGVARNEAVRVASASVIAFLDDDAHPDSSWLERLVKPYQSAGVMAVGGRPLPEFATHRPSWFPPEFDWVFGCAYVGMPEHTSPVRHLIGANMSVRREAFDEVGGFKSIDFDDLDLCQRLAHHFGAPALMYVPDAIVHHHVSAERVTWSYFWRRCFYVNRYKVSAFRDMGDAANLRAELKFVLDYFQAAPRRLAKSKSQRSNDAVRFIAGAIGISLAGLGNLVGKADHIIGSTGQRD